MQQFKSHKTVEAAKIVEARIQQLRPGHDFDAWGVALVVEGEAGELILPREWLHKHAPEHDQHGPCSGSLEGGYLVRYSDGYTSWSPAEAFEAGYTALVHDPKDGALPVSGYRPQTSVAVDCVNAMKAREELILRQLDLMREDADVDQRWLNIGRTSLEQAFMAINRSIFRPGRMKFPSEG